MPSDHSHSSTLPSVCLPYRACALDVGSSRQRVMEEEGFPPDRVSDVLALLIQVQDFRDVKKIETHSVDNGA